MKIKIRQNQLQGSALIVTLLTALIIGVALASFLTLVSNQNRSNMHGMAWNACIPMSEAGIEEALTQIRYNGITNLAANGWAWAADGLYHKSRVLGDGTSYEVTIKPVEPPIIVSRGTVPAPLGPASQVGMILAQVVSPNSTATPPSVKRRIKVNTSRSTAFVGAMVAKGEIDLAGNNVSTDSFDSSNPLYSTNGKYDSAKSRDKGDVVTNSKLVNSLNVGNANIKGHIATGPQGSVDIGPIGAVGSKAWIEGKNKGIQSGWSSDDMNLDIPDVQVPFTSGYSTPGGDTVGGTNYNYVLGTGNYKLSTLGGKVLVSGIASLWVTDSVAFTGQDYIYIGPSASLMLYVSAAVAKIGGNGVINSDANALSFQYFGLPSNTDVQFNGNASYTGVVYAPQAQFSLGGGGNNTYDFLGASVSKTVKMNGHFNFHYDEAIPKKAFSTGYVVIAWNEVDAYGEVRY